MRKYLHCAIFSFFIIKPTVVFANHGPSTSGGGINTQSGETINQGQFVFSLEENYTNYENISHETIENRAAQSGHFDALSDAFVTSTSFSYGVTDDLQLDVNIGWYSGRDFISAHGEEAHHAEQKSNLQTAHTVEGGHHHSENDEGNEVGHHDSEHHDGGHQGDAEDSTELGHADPEGLTDLTLRAKYRVIKGEMGHLSLIGGAIFPTGKDNIYLSNGEKLEPSSQPGSGRYSLLAGLAYSKYLTSHITLDLSSIYTYRFERNDFQIGERIDSGTAIAYRINDSITDFPLLSFFGELTHQYLGKDKEFGINNQDSGGNTLFLSTGVRAMLNKSIGIALAPAIPIVQDLNGEQVETDFRFTSSVFSKF